MHTIAGTFTTQEQALKALRDLEKQGVSPVTMKVIEETDKKGFEREHRSTWKAARQGAIAGAVFGLVVFGVLLGIAGASPFRLRYFALYLCGVALCKFGGAAISACWNLGTPHDDALLYEEARTTHAVIAAVEVSEPMEDMVILELERHGAQRIRSGNWQPAGWRHAHPAYDMAA
jgi:hypothetical protein